MHCAVLGLHRVFFLCEQVFILCISDSYLLSGDLSFEDLIYVNLSCTGCSLLHLRGDVSRAASLGHQPSCAYCPYGQDDIQVHINRSGSPIRNTGVRDRFAAICRGQGVLNPICLYPDLPVWSRQGAKLSTLLCHAAYSGLSTPLRSDLHTLHIDMRCTAFERLAGDHWPALCKSGITERPRSDRPVIPFRAQSTGV